MTTDERTRLIDCLRADLEALPRLAAAWLHGSVARGDARPESDVDLALLFEPGARPDGVSLLRLSGELESRCGRPAHLGLMSSRDVVYARQAILEGERIVERDAPLADLFEATILSMYADLQEARKEILRDYRTEAAT